MYNPCMLRGRPGTGRAQRGQRTYAKEKLGPERVVVLRNMNIATSRKRVQKNHHVELMRFFLESANDRGGGLYFIMQQAQHSSLAISGTCPQNGGAH